MPARTWPALRLTFPGALDDDRRDALLLDIDDCRAVALDEDGASVSLFFTAPANRDTAAT
ncbi:MAG: hypothetical protein H0V80_04355, partial [Acidobacteria bacterium]|nr:hypothetical protein [Acidobacteriota bacterium]